MSDKRNPFLSLARIARAVARIAGLNAPVPTDKQNGFRSLKSIADSLETVADSGSGFGGGGSYEWHGIGSGDGSTVAFNTAIEYPTGDELVTVGGVLQVQNYTFDGNTVTFSAAPPNGAAVWIRVRV